jgi:hypothetical protein
LKKEGYGMEEELVADPVELTPFPLLVGLNLIWCGHFGMQTHLLLQPGPRLGK